MTPIRESGKPFQQLIYANVWEDPFLPEQGLKLNHRDTVVSIGSAGDNTFYLLKAGPEKIYAIDFNHSQIALVNLKIAGIKQLERKTLAGFLGFQASPNRIGLYQKAIRPLLSEKDQQFWDKHQQRINQGVVNSGKFEHYFRLLRRFIFPLTHKNDTLKSIFEPKTRQERAVFFDKRFNNVKWKLLFRLFIDRRTMALFGRSKTHLAQVEASNFSELFTERLRYAMVDQDPSHNPFLYYIINGFPVQEGYWPLYLQEPYFQAIRKNLDRLTIVNQSLRDFLEAMPDNSVSAWNLSNIFEYMSLQNFRDTAEKLARVSTAKARFGYWNLLVKRQLSEILPNQFQFNSELSLSLSKQDRAFFYEHFYIDELTK